MWANNEVSKTGWELSSEHLMHTEYPRLKGVIGRPVHTYQHGNQRKASGISLNHCKITLKCEHPGKSEQASLKYILVIILTDKECD